MLPGLKSGADTKQGFRLDGGRLWCVSVREGGDFARVEADHEHGMRRDASPAEEFPLRADEADFAPERKVENLARLAAIKTLGHHQKRLGSPVLAVLRAPNRKDEGFLLDLIGDSHDAEERARVARADVVRLAFPLHRETRARRNQLKFHGHRSVSPQTPPHSNTLRSLRADAGLMLRRRGGARVLYVGVNPIIHFPEHVKNGFARRVPVRFEREQDEANRGTMPFQGTEKSLALNRERPGIVVGLAVNQQKRSLDFVRI